MQRKRGYRDDEKQMQLRVPPNNIDAEQAVLGCLMIEPSLLTHARAVISADDFYRRDHQLIYKALHHCEEKGIATDPVTLGDWFAGQGQLELVAGGAYLVDLWNAAYSAASWLGYAEIVANNSKMRQLVEIGTRVVNDAFSLPAEMHTEILGQAANSMEAIATSRTTRGSSAHDALRETMDEVKELYENGGDGITGIPTGFPEIDDATGGLQPGYVYGIGARPKMGKSTLALNIVDYAVSHGFPAVIFSLEMKKKQLMRHLIAARAGVNAMKLKRPRTISEDEWPRIVAATEALRNVPLMIYDDTDATIDDMMAQAQVLKMRGQCKLGSVDYLQLVTAPKGMDRRDLEIGYITRAMKRAAMRMDIPWFQIFQLNRGSEQGTTPRAPRASDARESGNIEQDLDSMWLLHRPRMYNPNAPGGCRLEFAIQREGESGKVIRLEDKDLQYNRFLPGERQWEDFDQETSRVQGGGRRIGKDAAAGERKELF